MSESRNSIKILQIPSGQHRVTTDGGRVRVPQEVFEDLLRKIEQGYAEQSRVAAAAAHRSHSARSDSETTSLQRFETVPNPVGNEHRPARPCPPAPPPNCSTASSQRMNFVNAVGSAPTEPTRKALPPEPDYPMTVCSACLQPIRQGPPNNAFGSEEYEPWYAVMRGLEIGCWNNWSTCAPLVNGIKGSLFQKYSSEAAARQAFARAHFAGMTRVLSPPSFG